MALAAAKARSNAQESLGPHSPLLGELEPWLSRPRSVLAPLMRRLDNPAPVTPGEYRNLMLVALRLAPSIGICSAAVGTALLPLPEDLDALPAGESWLAQAP